MIELPPTLALRERTCRLPGSRSPLPSIFSFHSLALAKVTRSHNEVTTGRIVRFCRQLSRRYRTRTYVVIVVVVVKTGTFPAFKTVQKRVVLASSPGSPSPFLTFSRARNLYAKYRRRLRESLVRNPAHPWPPGHGLGGHSLLCAFYCSRAAFWTVLTSLTDDKDYLGESF